MKNRESFIQYAVIDHPFSFLFMFFFAILGGYKIADDLNRVSVGSLALDDIVAQYLGPIFATVVLYFVQKRKARRQG